MNPEGLALGLEVSPVSVLLSSLSSVICVVTETHLGQPLCECWGMTGAHRHARVHTAWRDRRGMGYGCGLGIVFWLKVSLLFTFF